MWALFGKYASKHGYAPFGNHPCSSDGHKYPVIPHVNVGPQGDVLIVQTYYICNLTITATTTTTIAIIIVTIKSY